jgi:hypothetical protein
MSRTHHAALGLAGLLTLTLAALGCEQRTEVKDTPEQSAREALGVGERGPERTVESRRDVVVEDTTRVIDAKTGEVLKAEETRTPVTITEEKTVDRDVNVQAGPAQEAVK